jgi:rod shape-determining protein MreD
MTIATRLPPVLLVAVVLHTALAPQLRIGDVAADVMLLVAAAAGVAAGPDRGAVVGFFAGLLADCFLQTPFGLTALAYCLVGWGVGSFQSTILHAAVWIPMATVAVASAAGVLLYAGLGAVVGQGHLLSSRLVGIIVVVALVNALLTPVAVRVLRWATLSRSAPGLVLR